MKCPRCVQLIHRSAVQCPHCGFALQDLDVQYGFGDVRMRRLSDAAGVLRMPERRKAERCFDRFETSFPQLFFSVYYGALDEVSNIRQFGMWLLNRGAYEDVDLSKPNDGGILLVVDVNTKTAYITYGYLLDFYLTEADTFRVLSKAHPHLLKGEHIKALKIIVKQLSSVLRKRSRKANRNPVKYQKRAGCFPLPEADLLQPLRPTQSNSLESDDVLDGEVLGVGVAFAPLQHKAGKGGQR